MKQLANTLFVLTEGAYLSLEDENIVVECKKDRLGKVPLRSLDSILSFSYGGASPALMGKCSEMGVSLSFFSPRGKYYCSIFGESNRNVLLRQEQFRISDDESRSLLIAKNMILGKIFNARWVLERAKRDHAMRINVNLITQVSESLAQEIYLVRKVQSLDELRGIEGLSAKQYFSAFDELILRNKDDFFFEGRTRRPPMDNMNAILSFVYVLISRDCAAALQGVGLDPYVGFFHVERPGRQSLALDLVEELRSPLGDRFSLTLVNTGILNDSHFEHRENGGVFLNDAGRRALLTEWQKRKQDTLTHPFLNEKVQWGMIPYVQALLLARTIRGDLEEYPPFLWK
ncbi:type I-C CRISPR-associated endonuclease Cas1c [Alloscardovia venturai]|uniref:CRISPR-associated endonuclease Cas1 n=1 Tax=Alloscardovia venturai TaxID=1769421 RepID=A0ABW2Y3B0_9BIFI